MLAIAYQFIANEYDVHPDSERLPSPLRRPTVYFALLLHHRWARIDDVLDFMSWPQSLDVSFETYKAAMPARPLETPRPPPLPAAVEALTTL